MGLVNFALRERAHLPPSAGRRKVLQKAQQEGANFPNWRRKEMHATALQVQGRKIAARSDHPYTSQWFTLAATDESGPLHQRTRLIPPRRGQQSTRKRFTLRQCEFPTRAFDSNAWLRYRAQRPMLVRQHGLQRLRRVLRMLVSLAPTHAPEGQRGRYSRFVRGG